MGVVGLCWFITLLATLGGGYTLLETFASAQSAPQQAAGAAMAAGMVIVPYIFTRAVEGLVMVNRDLNARDARKVAAAAPVTVETPAA